VFEAPKIARHGAVWHHHVCPEQPQFVEDELRGYLTCGILCFGFARAVCIVRPARGSAVSPSSTASARRSTTTGICTPA